MHDARFIDVLSMGSGVESIFLFHAESPPIIFLLFLVQILFFSQIRTFRVVFEIFSHSVVQLL